MKGKGNFKFKEITKKDGGEFINKEGKKIAYKESFALKVDEITDDGIYERIFKLPVESPLIEPLLATKPYSDLTIEFDINLYGSAVRVIPVSIIK